MHSQNRIESIPFALWYLMIHHKRITNASLHLINASRIFFSPSSHAFAFAFTLHTHISSTIVIPVAPPSAISSTQHSYTSIIYTTIINMANKEQLNTVMQSVCEQLPWWQRCLFGPSRDGWVSTIASICWFRNCINRIRCKSPVASQSWDRERFRRWGQLWTTKRSQCCIAVIRLSTFFILPDPLTPIDPIWIERWACASLLVKPRDAAWLKTWTPPHLMVRRRVSRKRRYQLVIS